MPLMIDGISILLSAALAGGVPVPSTVLAAPKASVIVVHAKDFAFVAPKTVKSGTMTWRLVNDGKNLHHLQIVRLDKGKTMADYMAFLKKPGPADWMTEVGGPNAVLPGGTGEATLTLEPGDYVIVCFIPSAGDPTPHVMKGMMGSLKVVPAKSKADAPATDVTIRLSDYKFDVSTPFTAGRHTLNVVNDAAQAHEVVLIELPPGKTVGDFTKWVDKDLMKGPPPGMPIGGMTALAKGRSGVTRVTLKAGRYGMICFAPDAKDGKPHFAHGMTTEFTVK